MNLYKIGCNFDTALIGKITELNKKYDGKAKCVELFGSDAENAKVAARPRWRLPDIDFGRFTEYVQEAKNNGLIFNYTMNSIQPYGSKSEMVKHKLDIQKLVRLLENAGVYRITVANPMMAMFIREISNIEMEVSCIAHIDTVTQLRYYHEQLGFNKFCASILKNRNRDFLKASADYCNKNGLILELLANEFCGVAGVGTDTGKPYSTHCLYRDSCYLCHATNETKEESMSYNNYPMNFCMCSRSKNEEAWLRMRWIRPEDQKLYNSIGINYFKVSGRTGSTDYLMKVLEAYMSESFDGNLLELWKPLQTIYSGEAESSFTHIENIQNKKLDGFLNHWFDKNFECENQMCGETCTYCADFYKKNFSQNL